MQTFLNALALLAIACAAIQIIGVMVFRRHGDKLLVFLGGDQLRATEQRWLVVAAVAVLWLIFGRI